jgi:hypothetical protein
MHIIRKNDNLSAQKMLGVFSPHLKLMQLNLKENQQDRITI